ncbi:MAG TPA: hypothetical protein VI603_05175 [Saprospiraceae bacterium]|nr:hypothetical protein [Saprospiraceae bacterium]
MLNNYSKHDKKNFSILVDEEKLTELHNFLIKNFNKIDFSGTTSDNTQLKFRDIIDLFGYPNHNERRLLKIDIECREGMGDEEAGLSITLGNEYSFSSESVRYYLRYDNLDWGFRLDDELNKHLREFKTWYSKITIYDLTIGVPFLFFGFVMLYGSFDYVLKLCGYKGYIEYTANSTKSSSYLLFVLLVILFGAGYLLQKIRQFLFPKLFIALGKQKKAYLNRKTLSYVLFGVIALGIILNLFSSWLYNG